MADAVKAAPQGGDTMKTAQALGVILIVILGIFMVTSLNRVNAELTKMNQQVNALVTSTAQNTLAGFQAVNEEGELQWKFAPVPMATMSACGTGGACPSGAGGACSTGSSCATGVGGTAAPAAPAAK